MSVDWGVVFGLAGLAVGLGSIVYARTQSIHEFRGSPERRRSSGYVFFAQAGIVEKYHWRHWASAFGVVARVPAARLVYDNGIARDVWEPEFVAFLQPLFDGSRSPTQR